MDKRGQFYIIAAVIIVGLIIGFGTTYNSISKSEQESPSKTLLNEMQYEISQLIDSSVYKDLSKSEMEKKIDLLLDAYSYNHPDTELVMIFGNQHEIRLGTAYDKYYSLNGNQRVVGFANLTVVGEQATISLPSNENYGFPIKQQNLYLIVKIIKGEEVDVATNN